ncbi:restriction endonuclease subunit S [Streptomyces caniscabiei]|uniref:methylation-associated defense system restriction endonuclease subunit S MAD5 n=1 Tax=Streptomyces caniscabiei TaxID=2746961 RepID=UPI0029BA1BCC|nr:restriction endonuclease subunit S [Streptomyces caniscabiei]MDX2602731.1 restriction endonuclease subunit S [Streptomyces caniscabiei]MDX2737982.1 restriction endonuclease subunit S [Streptomyces caniscabiei]MDX2777230.1 restriction endonuclease subunit S [Streptomyces caniscabiei]
MKTASTENPVRLSWLREQGLRLDAAPYLSGAFAAKQLLKRLPETVPLRRLTQGEDGIFHAGRPLRRWVTAPEHGVPFFSSTDIMEADFSNLPLISKESVALNPRLPIHAGWTLITRSGNVGRIAYARPDVNGYACSEHVMRVVPNSGRVKPGYLNTFLRSRFGVPIITSHAYGAIIQHIEPHHIADLPVPRFGEDVENRIHDLVEEAASLRAEFQSCLEEATRDLFTTARLEKLLDMRWHDQPRDLGFTQRGLTPTTLRALNYQPRARRIINDLREVDHVLLGDICKGGQLSRGLRFTRVEGAEGSQYSYKLVGQRQAFWLRPEGRWVSKANTSPEVLAQDETILVASQGTLGENEVFGRPIFATGSWLAYAFSEHFLRVRPGGSPFTGAYLFAFLRSEPMFRVLRSMSTGGKQQDIHTGLCAEIPVPLLTADDRDRITETIRTAYRKRDEADAKEDLALDLLEQAVAEHTGVAPAGLPAPA